MKILYADPTPHVPQHLTRDRAFGFLSRKRSEPRFTERWAVGIAFITEAEPATDEETAYYQQTKDTSAMVVDISNQDDFDKYVAPYLV